MDDKKRRELIRARNSADSLIYLTEKTLKEHGSKISASDKQEVENSIRELKAALKSDNLELIKAKTDTLTASSMKIGEAMYKYPSGDDNIAESEASIDNKVVDANYEDVSNK